MLALSIADRLGNPAIRLVGSVSAEMFLLHGFVIEMLERHTDLCQTWPGLFVILVCLATFAGALALHRLLQELYKLIRL